MDRVSGSKIVVIASHKQSLLKSLCTRGLLLDQGRIVFDGDISEALAEYRRIYPVSDKAARVRRQKLLKSHERKLKKKLTAKIKKQLEAELVGSTAAQTGKPGGGLEGKADGELGHCPLSWPGEPFLHLRRSG